jgi:hypothetical protein
VSDGVQVANLPATQSQGKTANSISRDILWQICQRGPIFVPEFTQLNRSVQSVEDRDAPPWVGDDLSRRPSAPVGYRIQRNQTEPTSSILKPF